VRICFISIISNTFLVGIDGPYCFSLGVGWILKGRQFIIFEGHLLAGCARIE
jgi:hypothetical protein